MTRFAVASAMLMACAGSARAQDVIEIQEPLVVASATPLTDAALAEASVAPFRQFAAQLSSSVLTIS